MAKNLFLDDIRIPSTVKTYMPELGNGYFDVEWYIVVYYCIDNNLQIPNFVVHSQNPVGNKNIEGLLNNFKKFQEK